MEPGRTASRFKTTSWTLIAGARENRADLGELLSRYWSPVYAYLRRKGCGTHEAADLTQGFLADVMLDRDLVERADPDRGRFRSLLVTALERFVVDEHRKQHGRTGDRPVVFVPDDLRLLEAAEPAKDDDPARAFDRQWATAVLDEAIRRTEVACLGDGMADQWRIFDARVLQPARCGGAQTPVDQLAEEVGAADAHVIYSMVQTVKRKVQREMRTVVAETLADPADTREVDAELAELRALLAFPG
ncbi:MAG: sigma-70 family RNA polymerase sigma factor [Phycisphaerales bacterium]|nr:sigma-70 family RNA polymerase sigma factor [Phycisphaerales bacterium]